MDEQEKKALLSLIRARSQRTAVEECAQTPSDDEVLKASSSHLRRFIDEMKTAPNPAIEAEQRHRRQEKLQEIEQNLRDGEHVQNRMLETWLTEAEYAEIDEAWQQQQRMRSGSKSKPDSIKDYEGMLKRAQFYDGKAAGEQERGHVEAANRSYLACQNELCAAVIYLQERSKSDPAFITWLDRSIPADIKNVPLSDMPRSITSIGKDVRVQRLSKSEVKTAVVQAALQRLVNGTD